MNADSCSAILRCLLNFYCRQIIDRKNFCFLIRLLGVRFLYINEGELKCLRNTVRYREYDSFFCNPYTRNRIEKLQLQVLRRSFSIRDCIIIMDFASLVFRIYLSTSNVRACNKLTLTHMCAPLYIIKYSEKKVRRDERWYITLVATVHHLSIRHTAARAQRFR